MKHAISCEMVSKSKLCLVVVYFITFLSSYENLVHSIGEDSHAHKMVIYVPLFRLTIAPKITSTF